MRREDLSELHYITPISNVASIMKYGILSNKRAKKIPHESVAMREIQERRDKKLVPGGRPLHEYANLYICARNPMLYARKDDHEKLCVLRVSPQVLDLKGVVITDGNAASDYAIFKPAPDGIEIVDLELTFAEYWTDGDLIEAYRKKAAKCAEVLVPDRVEPHLVTGAYTSSEEARAQVQGIAVHLQVTVNAHLFFR